MENSMKGYIIDGINKLRKEKHAIILSHYYQNSGIQDIADYVGDSLDLAQHAAKTDAEIIIVCGVDFMGETVKIICPDKKVLIPDLNANCSLADSCPLSTFESYIKAHPGYKIISYINTSAEIKALSDVVVTSSNAYRIVNSFPENEKLIFAPDRNLGEYINRLTGRHMLLWNGYCHMHEKFSLDKLLKLIDLYPMAEVIAHPECTPALLHFAKYIGSTSALVRHIGSSSKKLFIVATECGMLHEMRKQFPDKNFIPAPTEDSFCNECVFMRQNTLEKLYRCLKNETPEITLDSAIIEKASQPIQLMLKLSEIKE